MKKRVLSIILAMLLVITATPVSKVAAETEYEGPEWATGGNVRTDLK